MERKESVRREKKGKKRKEKNMERGGLEWRRRLIEAVAVRGMNYT